MITQGYIQIAMVPCTLKSSKLSKTRSKKSIDNIVERKSLPAFLFYVVLKEKFPSNWQSIPKECSFSNMDFCHNPIDPI